MKKTLKMLAFNLLLIGSCHIAQAQEIAKLNTTRIMHNKGQIKTEQGAICRDIDFVVQSKQVQVLIAAGKIEYRFLEKRQLKTIVMQLKHTSSNVKLLAEGKSSYTENYYLGTDVIENVATADRVCYKNIYEGIDWVLYLNQGKLEHEFVLAKGADARQIQWSYKGVDKHYIDEKGNIVLQSDQTTITEIAPQSFEQNGETIQTKYRFANGTFAYSIPRQNSAYTIDPSVEWATYHRGDDGMTRAFSTAKDNSGNLYLTGVTTSTIGFSSPSAHQGVNGGLEDAFISKFDTLGNHIWTTYYGGIGKELFSDIQYQNGKLYVAGHSSSSTGIATPGTQQPALITYPGVLPVNAVLIKMDTNGKRIWGTYCGDGKGGTIFNALAVDSKENVYCAGSSTDPTMVASTGSFKDTFARTKADLINPSDAILVKYDSNGKRVWGTYIGDTMEDIAQTISIYQDIVYLGGHTRSQRGIATSGTHKSTFTPFDAMDREVFIIRFDANGKRLWGTYYGGKAYEGITSIALNKNGSYFYVYGGTYNGDTALSSVGAYQRTPPGDADCFLAKFDTSCKRIWGTYIGTPLFDESSHMSGKITVEELSDDGNVWIMGQTRGKGKGIATIDAYKDSLNSSGKRDAFIGCISPLGKPIYFSYYGGEEDDWANCAFVYGQTAYLVGSTLSNTGIATAGSHIDTYTGGGHASYLVKFGPSKPSLVQSLTLKDMEWNIFPNPVNAHIQLKGLLSTQINKTANISILNVVGKTVQSQNVDIVNGILNHKIELFQSLQPGMYQFVINIEGQNISKQFIKK